MIRYLKHLFIDTWAEAEKNSIEEHSRFKKNFVNISTLVILVYAAIGVSLLKYYGSIATIRTFFDRHSPGEFDTWFYQTFYTTENAVFNSRLFWCSSLTLFYLVIPIIIIKFGFKQQLRDYGISIKNVHKDYPIYLLMLVVMIPVLYIASTTVSFQHKYPLFQPSRENMFPLFIWWELAYLLQFIAVEFFYRGFLIHGLKKRFGFYSIFISTIPYCMIHFGKPFGETISSIIAGIVLGTLSLKSRSIVLGILIHYSVGITMDLLALYQKGFL